jgi:hypothetical protein
MSNRARGDAFQRYAAGALAKATGLAFDLEVPLIMTIGAPKSHFFDLATPDRAYVGESKAFTWTVSGKVPSAKVTTLREAAQYLRALSPQTKTFIVMARSEHPLRQETLAEYFSRLNDHVLGKVALIEVCDKTGTVRFVRGGLP